MNDDDVEHQQYLAQLRDVMGTLRPQLNSQPIWYETFQFIRPWKMELIDDKIWVDGNLEGAKLALLKLLMTEVGLAEVVKLASIEEWHKALKDSVI